MARLQQNTYPQRTLNSLINPKVIVVDMINGFAKKGALADPAIADLSKPIETLLLSENAESLFVCDAHKPGCREFDFFPEHALENSEESQVLESLAPYAKKRIEKNAINTFTSPQFGPWLSSLPEECDIVITGCCTDLCILQLALSLQSWISQNEKTGWRVVLPVNCVDTYDIPGVHEVQSWNAFALANMAANGIEVVSALV